MSGRHRPRSVRVRLTLWYTGAMVVVLAVYAACVFIFVSSSLSRGLDDELRADLQWPMEMLERLPDGRIAPTGVDDSMGPWLQVWSTTGDLLYQTWRARRQAIPHGEELARLATGGIVQIPEEETRVLTQTGKMGGDAVVFQVAVSEERMRTRLRELLLLMLLGLPLGVAAAGLGGYSLARRALAPVDRMAERARLITAERLQDRLPVDNPNDELGRLATVFNETLTRLESSFEQMRRFTADASHELRTPLTAMRSVGEVGLRGKRDEAAYREIIGSMLEEVDRLSDLVDRLLTMSRADNGQLTLSREPVDLGELVEEVVGQLDVLAEEKQQSLSVEKSGALSWTGDRLVLRQALLNLVDNAIKYTPAGGRITIRAHQSADGVTVEVIDTGPGIPSDLQPRIFDRFYRVDASRSRENGGTGLGLSIAKWAVEASGGRLTLETAGGAGSRFRITLPEL